MILTNSSLLPEKQHEVNHYSISMKLQGIQASWRGMGTMTEGDMKEAEAAL